MKFDQKALTSISRKALFGLPLLVAGALIGVMLIPRLTDRVLVATSLANQASQNYQLIEGGIEDGQSLRVTDGHREINIRLCGISAPGLNEPGGIDAQAHLRQLAWQGDGKVTLVSAESNGERPWLAEVFVSVGEEEEIHLNTQMLVDGMAYLSLPDTNRCPNGDRLAVAEDMAKQKGVGVWSQPLEETENL